MTDSVYFPYKHVHNSALRNVACDDQVCTTLVNNRLYLSYAGTSRYDKLLPHATGELYRGIPLKNLHKDKLGCSYLTPEYLTCGLNTCDIECAKFVFRQPTTVSLDWLRRNNA